jgi:TfoX/Sxy family transcriptional regulator of competence genes
MVRTWQNNGDNASAAMSIASARERALEIVEGISRPGGLDGVVVSRFFSGAGLRRDGVLFGFVHRGSLYLRVDDASRPDFEARGAKPFSPPGRSRMVSTKYYEAPDAILDDPDELGRWAARAHRAAVAADAFKRSKSAKSAKSAMGAKRVKRVKSPKR